MRARRIMVYGAVATIAIVAAACSGGGTAPRQRRTAAAISRGGTLRVRLVNFDQYESAPITTPQGTFDLTFDPVWDFSASELFRCCLLRTLLSYNGHPAEQGGSELRPDLATTMPQVSGDLLTWTFHIRPGLRYGPPFQGTEIKAQDIVRAVERSLRPVPAPLVDMFGPSGPDPGQFAELVVGAADFAAGKTDRISGLEVPDDRTLVVRLTHPSGDLPYLFSLPFSAPVPPGASDGHDAAYGRYLVSSGPYMFEGSERLDFSRPPKDQAPVSGYVPLKSITLVRNPSWDPAADILRKAYVDRMEFAIGGTRESAYRDVLAGREDLVTDADPTVAVYNQIRNSPGGALRVYNEPDDVVNYVALNVAAPPLDDVHVRRAVSYAIDKAKLHQLAASGTLQFVGPFGGTITGHTVPDSLEQNLLVGYDPYPFDLNKARAEMAMSRYDRNRDGSCDAPECASVYALSRRDDPFFTEEARAIEDDLKAIGIHLSVETLDGPGPMYQKARDPKNKVVIVLGLRYQKDFPDASSFFQTLLSSATIGGSNFFLLGASPRELASWGYPVRSVPTVDPKIEDCLPKDGRARLACWAELDQLVMEEIVPYVPYLSGQAAAVASSRVLNLTFDQFADSTALDQVGLAGGS